MCGILSYLTFNTARPKQVIVCSSPVTSIDYILYTRAVAMQQERGSGYSTRTNGESLNINLLATKKSRSLLLSFQDHSFRFLFSSIGLCAREAVLRKASNGMTLSEYQHIHWTILFSPGLNSCTKTQNKILSIHDRFLYSMRQAKPFSTHNGLHHRKTKHPYIH